VAITFPLIANTWPPVRFSFGAELDDQRPSLVAANECFCINLGGATLTGGTLQVCSLEFTVE
jgi:hypothetical protein